MPITFEDCCFCGKYEMRVEGNLFYNQSLNVFYYAWICYSCNGFIYNEIEFVDMENAERKKECCIWFHNWNEMVTNNNQKLTK